MMEKKIVIPGEEIGICEEFIGAEGTYEDNGKIFSAILGVLELDLKEKTARVRPTNPPTILQERDVVIATITDLRNSLASVSIVKVEGKDRKISGDRSGSIRIANISDSYVSDIHSELRIGDTIRGKVIQVKPSLQLTTKATHLGVLNALCTRCRFPLKRKGKELFCENCTRTETRKTASDYGDVEIQNGKR